MSRIPPLAVWPAPPPPGRTPWQPDPRPPTLPPAAPSRVTVRRMPRPTAPSQFTVIDTSPEWLAERLLGQRTVLLAGWQDSAAVNRAAASLALLDASGDDPIELRIVDVDADLDAALTLLDAVDLVGVPLHATCLGELRGAAVAILAVADHRVMGPHATLHLRGPRTQAGGHAGELTTHAEDRQRRLRLLQERIAAACQRTVDVVVADMRKGRILTAEQARGYGLVDVISAGRHARG